MTRHRIFLLAILLLAAGLRLPGLANGSPPGLAHDEVANWLIDHGILAGEHAVYFTRAYGHEAGFHYLQAGFVALLGDHALALRLPAAFLGMLLVAVGGALARRLYGRFHALTAAALLAVLLWPVFFSRLGLRAISLPVLAGLSALFWWWAWDGHGARSGKRGAIGPAPRFALAGALAGLSLHTYMAARAVPIFYALWLAYLLLFDRPALRARWRGVALFWLLLALTAAPLAVYLLSNPGAEFRIAEVDAPLRALRSGDPRPVFENALRILGGFGVRGDPLWRQNVAGRPVFDPLLAVAFYAGVLLFLWRWRTPKYAFVLLWLATFTTPSLVTVDAPSTIRMINLLPFLPLPVAEVMHNLGNFSTKNGRLSTNLVYLGMTALVAAHIWGTGTAVFRTWPRHPEVQFVWQAAFTDMGVFLDANSAIETAVSPAVVTAAIAGWTPATLDVPTMALLLQRPDARLSHFDPLDGTLLLPAPNADGTRTLLRPNILELDPYWESQLAAWHAAVTRHPLFTQYAIRNTPYAPQSPITATFGAELRLRGTTTLADGFITHWEVLAAPTAGRRLFLQWLDAAGNVLAEDYRLDTADPQNLWFPHWQPGDLLLQRHPAPPPGAAQLRLGWFDPATCSPGPCQNLPTAAGEPFLLLP